VLIAGQIIVSMSDSETRRFGPGAVFLVEDHGSRGHLLRAGDEDVLLLIVRLIRRTGPQRHRGASRGTIPIVHKRGAGAVIRTCSHVASLRKPSAEWSKRLDGAPRSNWRTARQAPAEDRRRRDAHDVVVEGVTARMTDEAQLERIAASSVGPTTGAGILDRAKA
jgi:hypothetical protein